MNAPGRHTEQAGEVGLRAQILEVWADREHQCVPVWRMRSRAERGTAPRPSVRRRLAGREPPQPPRQISECASNFEIEPEGGMHAKAWRRGFKQYMKRPAVRNAKKRPPLSPN